MADTPETRKSYVDYLAEVSFLDKQIGKLMDILDEENLRENTAFTIEATVVPECEDGIILACGGVANGYSLAIREGKAVFAVNTDNRKFELRSPEPLNGKVKITGRLDEQARAALDIDGKTVAMEQLPGLIAKLPNEAMQIGLDAGTQVNAAKLPGYIGVIEKANEPGAYASGVIASRIVAGTPGA